MRLIQKGKGTDLLILLIYLVLALALTYPLILNMATHVIGWNIDEGIFLWNLWWVRHSLIDLHSSPFYTTDIFFPIGVSLVYYTLTLVNAVAFLPLQLVAGPIVTLNVLTIISYWLSAFGMYLLARYLLKRTYVHEWIPQVTDAPEWLHVVGAFSAGLVFAFSAPRMIYAAQGSSNLTSAEWIPFFALYFLKACDKALGVEVTKSQSTRTLPWKDAIIAGGFLLLAAFTELTYAVFLLMFAAIYVAKLVWENRTSPRTIFALSQQTSLAGLTFFLGFLPMLYLVWVETSTQGDYLSTDWGYADAFSADLLGFFTPSRLHPIFGKSAVQQSANFTDLNLASVGYVVMALALAVGIRFRNKLSFWITSALVFAVLSLGPVLHINGVSSFDFDGLKANFPLPFIVLHFIPLIKGNRMPHRFSILLSLALAVMVAFAVVWLLGRFKSMKMPRSDFSGIVQRLSLAAVIPLAICFESLSVPLPLNNVTPSPFYQMLGEDKEDYAILQLPLGWRNSYGMMGIERTMIQAFQFAHKKKMLAGNTSRNPDFKFAYFAGIPVLKTIADLEKGFPVALDQIERDRGSARDVVELYDIRYLAVHRDYVEPAAEEYAREVLPLEKVYDDGSVAGYRIVREYVSTPEEIDFGTPSSNPYKGDGWSGDERLDDGTSIDWAIGNTSVAFFSNYSTNNIGLGIRLKPFVYPGMPQQILELLVNGQTLGKFNLEPQWKVYAVEVPSSDLEMGLNELEFRFQNLASPNKALPGDYSIGRTNVQSPVDITVEAAGMLGGDYSRIRVNDTQVSKQGRGYNVVAISASSGRVVDSQSFDTFGFESESARMAQFIKSIPEGTVVVAAVKDDASKNLTQEAVEALGLIGAQADLRGKFRWSHSMIGVKGALPGQSIESLSEKANSLHVGSNVDKRTLGAAIDYIKFESRAN